MKKIAGVFMVMVALLISTFSFAAEQKWSGNLNLLTGTKTLDKDDTAPVDKQKEIGVMFDIGFFPVVFTTEILSSSVTRKGYSEYSGYYAEAKVEGSTRELRFGAKYIFDVTPDLHPYVVAGSVVIIGEAKLSYSDSYGYSGWAKSSASGTGYWGGGGVYYTLGKHFNIGGELSYSSAQVKLFDTNMEAGGTHANVFLGYHW
jgi:opacity protein-like surface antigen